MRFLVSRLSSLGDVICTLPVAAALKAAFSDCTITWVVDKKFAGAVECCSAVDFVIPVKLEPKLSSLPELEGEFDAALDMQGLLKSAIIVLRTKAKLKLGYHWQREGAWLFSQRVVPDPSSLHIVDQYVDVARSAGGVMDRASFCFAPTDDQVTTIKARLDYDQVDRFVVMNPGAGWESKRWPESHFSELADMFAGQGLSTVLIGARSNADHQTGERVIALAKSNPISWIGQTQLGELAALLSLAECHIGGDTGSTHMGAALCTKCVGLYSVTNPKRSCPYGQVDNCLYDPNSIANISPSQAFQKFKEIAA